MKLPQYVVRNILYRLGLDAQEVKTSNSFVHKAKCPLCQDYKTRMYIKEYPNFYSVHCHNCGYNTNFLTFIKTEYPYEYDGLGEFFMESIKSGEAFKPRQKSKKEVRPKSDIELADIRLRMYLKQKGFRVAKPQKSGKRELLRNRVISYLEGRKIPKEVYSDFWIVMRGPLRGYIGIPFFDKNKSNLLHIQGRLYADLGRENPQKYLFLKDIENELEIELPGKEIWGLWRTDPEKLVVICEGTLDAVAFENGIATCGATISDSFIRELKEKYPNRIWSVDNYWSDKEGRKLTERLLKMGESCFILPNESEIKDANNLIQKMDQKFIPLEYINNHTYTGKLGLAKLQLKKKEG